MFSKHFKELYYLSTEKSDLVYEIKCKENLEFQNLTLSNDEIIERFEKLLKIIWVKKIIISYKEKDEKDKALNLLNYLNLSNYRDANNNIEDCMDDLDIIDLVLMPISQGFELSLLKIITINEIFRIKSNIRPKKVRNNLIDIAQLLMNDLVVHLSHG